MNNTMELSKQQLKSKRTKERIFRAAKEILQQSGYENLSIKNICEEAGVSNGSFYHHFKTKDDLLSYYIEERPSVDPDLLSLPKDKAEAKATILSVYADYAQYCKELGVEFVAGYYTPHNQALHPVSRSERPYPIVTVQKYLEKAVNGGAIKLTCSVDEAATDIRMIVIGNAFDWALQSGESDIEANMNRSLSNYLNGIMI